MAVAAATPHPYRTAVEARDVAAIADALAPDVVLHSPITSRLRFEGRDEVAELLKVVLFEALDDVRVTDEVVSGDALILVFRARAKGQELEGVDFLRLDAEGRIREFKVFIRPLPGLTAATQAIGTKLSRRRGRARSAVVALLSRQLAALTRAGDRLVVGLVKRPSD